MFWKEEWVCGLLSFILIFSDFLRKFVTWRGEGSKMEGVKPEGIRKIQKFGQKVKPTKFTPYN